MLEFEASLQHWLEISYTLVSEFLKSGLKNKPPSKQTSKQAVAPTRYKYANFKRLKGRYVDQLN
jgi:hypothetical protein